MSFSDWQMRRLRSRLRAYREQQGMKKNGRPLPWKAVGSVISRTLNLKFDLGGDNGERLRQFVEGVPVEKGSKEMRYRIPEDHRLEAIRDFLLHKDVRYLSEHELTEDTAPHPAALSMLDYLNQGGELDPLHPLASAQVTGTYQHVVKDITGWHSRRLSFKPLSDGLFEIEEAVEDYDTGHLTSDFADWRQADKLRQRRLKRLYTGWAVKNANDCLYLFLKDSYDASQVSYIADARHKPPPDDEGRNGVQWLLLQSYGPSAYAALGPDREPDEARERVVSDLSRRFLLTFARAE